MNARNRFPAAVVASLVGAMLAVAAHASLAQDAINLGTVQSSAGDAAAGAAASRESAPYQAPTQGSLSATQPQSIISQHYIQENAAPTANYTDIVSSTPSVWSVDPNGPGMAEAQGMTMRGFADGQFNVTFDGIPWGDSNDFTHHSTTYFMAQDLGQIVVDRGPGSASTIGPATFGGTIAVSSKDPLAGASITPYATLGSFNTRLGGVEFDSGQLQRYGDAAAFIDYKQSRTDGWLDNLGQRRKNLFFKLVKPAGEDTLVTMVAMVNSIHQNISLGSTAAQIAQYGPRYALNRDPSSQAYYDYNYDDITSDFEYLGVNTRVGGWKVDNKVYTYAYDHFGFNGLDPNGETPNGTIYGPNNVPGQKMTMQYRSVGDLLRMSQPLGPGDLDLGIWGDHQNNLRWQYEVDFSNGLAYNAPTVVAATDRNMRDTLDQLQPYVEYAWKLSPDLTLTPGVKYVSFRRSIDAEVNQKTGTPLSYSKTWTKALPSVDLHYMIEKGWSAYAQLAKGFLAPNLNTFYTADPSASDLNPEQTTNAQVGTAWKSPRLTVSGDVYYIDFNNKVESRTIAGNTVFFNAGGAIYKGVEGEATYYAGSGFSIYANGSVNSAKEKDTGQWMPNTPKSTAAAGVIYNAGPVYASALVHYIGSRYGDTGETQPLSGYSVTSLAASYTLENGPGALRGAKVGLQLNNVFDKTDIFALAGYTGGANTPLYWTIPGRSVMVTLSASL